MSQLALVSRERHAGKRWRRFTHFGFAATQAVAPLVGAEAAKAALSMPTGFLNVSGRFVPAALLSPIAGRNLFVGPDGRWMGRYVPAALRSWPFVLVRQEGAEQAVLCVDEASGLVEAEGTGEDFFDAAGNPSSAVKGVLEFLTAVEAQRTATDLAVAALAAANVIGPWG